MRNLEAHTRLGPNEVIKRALGFFGPGGLGLQIKQRQLTRVEFEGGGGGITISVLLDLERGGTVVEISEREWDRKVEDFLASLPAQRSRWLQRLPVLGRFL
ncbi:MAG: hypothetical protein HY330_04425 [Chloroflexi bacterium]|nr:hypothetical protein [Chloroflexota bacterium]